jgi:hypothetical protein
MCRVVFLSIGRRILQSRRISLTQLACSRSRAVPLLNNLSRIHFRNAPSRNRPLAEFFEQFSTSKDFFQRIDWLFALEGGELPFRV